ncbi:aminotransferase class V-fold PLP-dependent enzyme [Oleispirillum naphthae]|uniref:aminotransferase class V-fold PLP-dependent enzyme n=1 Tax=Oleispirillum naphthae TaxID=2838853 RepID=UPI003082672E
MAAIYLDNNATTRVDPRVVEAMLPFLTEHYGNASSRHGFGAVAAAAVRAARRQVQGLIGASHESEVIFTSGGSESDATAILSAVRAHPGRRAIVTSAVEHAAVQAACRDLEKEGYEIREIGVDGEGRLDVAAYAAALGPDVALATLMWANNETGAVFPIAELAAMAHAAGVVFHTDAVQAGGKAAIDVAAAGVDMLSLSGHKLHAPKGIGVLYLRRGTRFRPLLRGGHQEKGRRAGTENVPAIVALGAAADLARRGLAAEASSIAALRDALQAGVCAAAPGAWALAAAAERLPNTLAVVFPEIEGEAMLAHLDRKGIAASGGSACSAGSMTASHVPLAMGLSPTLARGMIRFSLSRETTAAEIAFTVAAVGEAAARISRGGAAPARAAAAYV